MTLRTALLALTTVSSISISHAETYEVKESETYEVKESETYIKPIKVNTQEQFDTIYKLLDEHQATFRAAVRNYFELKPHLVGSIEYEKSLCADLAFKLSKYEFVLSNYEFVGKEDSNYDAEVFSDSLKKPEYKKCLIKTISLTE